MAKSDKGGCSVHPGIYSPANEEGPHRGQMGVAQKRRPQGLSLCPYLSVHWSSGRERQMVHSPTYFCYMGANKDPGILVPSISPVLPGAKIQTSLQLLLNPEEPRGENVQRLNSQKF